MSGQFNVFSIVLIVLLTIWLSAVTFFLFKAIHHYNTLVKTSDRKSLTAILEQIVGQTKSNRKTIIQIDERLKEMEKRSEFQMQKMGLVRYNPFADTGGEQSFVISLLDNYNSGMILTSLQGRSGTRWYAKQVKKGKGVEFDLSKEEEEAVKKAKKLS